MYFIVCLLTNKEEGDKGEGGSKNPIFTVTSFLNDPKLNPSLNLNKI